ncbi:MAG: hypothetical protein AD742_08555 [Methylibium sp. NZG]|nr:MAG: hypothetical protein AD742_08555 [Methylibium sp. NZG]
MTSTRITLAALALSVSALAQASEVTNFPITAGSLSRAEVQAEARKHYATGSMSVNFAGFDTKAPVAALASSKSRADVQKELAAARGMADSRVAAGYLVGGM